MAKKPTAAKKSVSAANLEALGAERLAELLMDAAGMDPALAGEDVAALVLAEALATRLGSWASWIGRGAGALEPGLARKLLAGLVKEARPTGKLALVVRKLADRAGDLDAWIHSIPEEDARKPEIGAEIARRLALAGRGAEARAALELARAPEPKARWVGKGEAEAPPDAWMAAEIAVLEAEGRTEEADEERWARFARTLSAEDLRALIARLPDFEDVEALDRAFGLAADHPDAVKALAFLMGWPALREAAEMVLARPKEIRGGHEDTLLWAGRLAGRYPEAAVILLRARARTLLTLGSDVDDEVASAVAEAEALSVGLAGEAGDHAGFVAELQGLRRRRW